MNNAQTLTAESLPQPAELWMDGPDGAPVIMKGSDGFMYEIDAAGRVGASWEYDPADNPAPDTYRFAVGVDSTWGGADIYEDPAAAIAAAIAAAKRRDASGGYGAYAVAVYLIA